jgi:hypothetical protein
MKDPLVFAIRCTYDGKAGEVNVRTCTSLPSWRCAIPIERLRRRPSRRGCESRACDHESLS